jgi:hypothetical protein
MGKCNCQHPERKQDNCGCSQEQVKECHGDVKKHPCECDQDN